LTIRIGRRVLFAGNAELFELYSRKLTAAEQHAASLSTLFSALFIPSSRPKHEYMGFGPGFLLLAPSALLAIVQRIKRARPRTSLATILAMVWVPALYLMSDDFAAQRATWYIVLGRLIASLPALIAVLAAQRADKPTRALLAVASVLGLSLAWPLGCTRPVVEGVIALLPGLATAVACALAVGLVVASLGKERLRFGPAALTLIATFILVFASPWATVRTQYRYRIYEAAAADAPAFVMHYVWDFHASAWPIWQLLDDGRPHRIAAYYGWDGLGHNGLRYPLTGSELQNAVLYVPSSRTGEVIDYRDEEKVASSMDESAWLARLASERIDYVVTGFPAPPEQQVIERHPEAFERAIESRDGRHAAYRFKYAR